MRLTFVLKMKEHAKIVINVGALFDSDEDAALNIARTIPRDYFRSLCEARHDGFNFLTDLAFPEAFAYVKGLIRCEEARISPYPGSTSLVIWAFNVLQRRPLKEWTTIAVWIVQNHKNPYSPFNFRRTRDHWEAAMREVDDPIEVARRAVDIEGTYQARKRTTADRQFIREQITKLKKGISPDSPEIRQRMIEEMEREAGWPE